MASNEVANISAQVGLTKKQMLELATVDSNFFSRAFFPKTVRQPSPKFHLSMWDALNDPAHSLVNLMIFRGGAKTTLARLYTARRVAFDLSRTIVYIGKSEGHAIRSIRWLKRQIEHNQKFVQFFGLTPGKPWSDTEIRIENAITKQSVFLLGMGVTGSVRGINDDDNRPDLIVLDDLLDMENCGTLEQIEKINELIYGAVVPSLAPKSEAPRAKVVSLATPQDNRDYTCVAEKDEDWFTVKQGIYTEETANLPLHERVSAWPERWTSETVQKEEAGYARRNQASIFAREKKIQLIAKEDTVFRAHWLGFYDQIPERDSMAISLAIDPVPPPSPAQLAKGLHKKDFEVLAVVGRVRGTSKRYLLEYQMNRGHNPNWTIATFFSMFINWRPDITTVETVGYQRTLKWLLEKEMQERGIFAVMREESARGRGSKYDHIVDTLSGPASQGQWFVSPEHAQFIEDFGRYPSVDHDDLLDCVAMADKGLTNTYLGVAPSTFEIDLLPEEYTSNVAQAYCP